MKKNFLVVAAVLLGMALNTSAVVWNDEIDNAAKIVLVNGTTKFCRMRMAVSAFRGLQQVLTQYPLVAYAQELEQHLNFFGGLSSVSTVQPNQICCVNADDFAKFVSVFHSYNAL